MSGYDLKDDASYWAAFEAEVEKSTPAKVDRVIEQLPASVKVWRCSGSPETAGGCGAATTTNAVIDDESDNDTTVDVWIAGGCESYVVSLQSAAACNWVTDCLDVPEERWLTDLEFWVDYDCIADVVLSAQANGLRVQMA